MKRRLADIMTTEVESVTPKTSLEEAGAMMARRDVGMLPVVDEGRQVVGTLTDRDIVVNCVSKGGNPSETPVSAAMSPEVVSCNREASIEEASELMRGRKIRRLVVMDGKEIAGIVSLGDVAKEAESAELVSRTLAGVS